MNSALSGFLLLKNQQFHLLIISQSDPNYQKTLGFEGNRRGYDEMNIVNWLQKISELSLRFVDECTGYHHGQTNCIIGAYLGDRPVGYLEYSIFEGNAHITDVQVAEDLRRQGIATQMFRKLEQELEGKIIHTMQTPEGAQWVSSL